MRGKNGYLPGWDRAHFDKIAYRGVGSLRVACPIVEYIAIGRIMADHIRAREAAEEQHPPLQRVRHRNGRGRRSDIPNKTEYLVFLVELLHGLGGASRLKAVAARQPP